MYTKKTTRKKVVKRVEKRKKKRMIQFFLLTLALSVTSVLLSYFLSQKEIILSPVSGSTLAAEDSVTQEIQNELQHENIHADGVTSTKDQVTIKLSSTEEVIISPLRDIRSQLASLQLITARLTMEGKHFTRLDLRFDKPVIAY